MVDERHEEMAQAFLEQYNHAKGTHYEFECLRRSMFSTPKYQFPAFKIYQMAFIEGKKRSPIVADLMVLLRLQKRLIVEVVKPRLRQDDIGDMELSTREIESIIDPIETDAVSKVVCSKYLLIDGRDFRRTRVSAPEIYKKARLERDKMLEKHERLNKELGIKEDRMPRELLSQLGISIKHWFEEIWLSYHDEKGVVRCLQIW